MANGRERRARAQQRMIKNDREFREALSFLVIMWANAESWFHRVLAVLLKIDVALAELVYTNTFSTRSRVELVQRCGKMVLKDARRVGHLQKLASEFEAVSHARNKLCHAEYVIQSGGTLTTAIVISNFQRRDFDGTNYHDYQHIDRNLINEVRQAHERAVSLCGRLERFVKTAPKYLLDQPRSTPLQLPKRRKRQPTPKKRP